jgi:molybdenum cofactor cytidylyltransferase
MATSKPHTSFALLPAAGQSTRMGRPKLSLPLGDCTILEQVVRTFREGGVGKVLVVLGPASEDLAGLAERAGAKALVLREGTADMRATVEHGLAWFESEFAPQPNDPWLLCPADHPVLEPGVIVQLLEAWQRRGSKSILVPTFQGQRGHPTAIAWRHCEGIRSLPPSLGMNVYLRKHADETLEVPMTSDSILFDLDTPEDYLRLLQR